MAISSGLGASVGEAVDSHTNNTGGAAGEAGADINFDRFSPDAMLVEHDYVFRDLDVEPQSFIESVGSAVGEVFLGAVDVIAGIINTLREYSPEPARVITNHRGDLIIETERGRFSVYSNHGVIQFPADLTAEDRRSIINEFQSDNPRVRTYDVYTEPALPESGVIERYSLPGAGTTRHLPNQSYTVLNPLTPFGMPVVVSEVDSTGQRGYSDSLFGGAEISIGHRGLNFGTGPSGIARDGSSFGGLVHSGTMAGQPGVVGDVYAAIDMYRSPIPEMEFAQRELYLADEIGTFNQLEIEIDQRVNQRLAEEGISWSPNNTPAEVARAHEISREEWDRAIGQLQADGVINLDPSSQEYRDNHQIQGALPDGTAIVQAGYINSLSSNVPAGLTFSTDSGDRYVVAPGGQPQLLTTVLGNLAATIRTGGTLGPNQRALVSAMTPEQQRASGIFLRPDGTALSINDAVARGLTNLAAGRPLSANQQAALGLVFNNIASAGDRRDAIIQLSQATGIDAATLNQAAGSAMRFATGIANTAATQTQNQGLRNVGIANPNRALERLEAAGIANNAAGKLTALAAAGVRNPVARIEQLVAQGVTNPVQRLLNEARRENVQATTQRLLSGVTPGTTYTTQGGRTVTAADVARRAARNLADGKPLTATQQRLVRDNQVRAGTTALLRNVNASRTFTTPDGRVRTAAQVAERAARNRALGRPLSANQRALVQEAQRTQRRVDNLRAAGVRNARGKIVALQQAGIRKPVQAVTRLRNQGVRRATTKLITAAQGGIRKPAQAIARLRQANVRRGVQKVVRLKQVGVRHATAKVIDMQRRGIQGGVARLEQLRRQGVRNPYQALVREHQQRQQQAVQRTQQRAREAQQSRQQTFTTRAGQTRTRQQVLQNAARNQRTGRALTVNQQRAVQQRAVATQARLRAAQTQATVARQQARDARTSRQQTFRTATGQTRSRQQVIARARANQAAGRALTANQQTALQQQRTAQQTRSRSLHATMVAANRRQQQVRQNRQQTFTTRTGQTRARQQVVANARANQRAGRALTTNQQTALQQRAVAQRTRTAAAQARARFAANQVQQARRDRTMTFQTNAGQTRTRAQVITNARANLRAGRALTTNQRLALQERANVQQVRHQAALAQANAARQQLRQARQERTQAFTTRAGQTRTRQQVLANAARNQAQGRALTENQQRALAERQSIQNARQQLRQADRMAQQTDQRRVSVQRRDQTQPSPRPRPQLLRTQPAPRVQQQRQQPQPPRPQPAWQQPRQPAWQPPAPRQQQRPQPAWQPPAPRPQPPRQQPPRPQPPRQQPPHPQPPRQQPTYTTSTGQVRTQAQVLANARRNLKQGRALTANQRRALRGR